MSKLEVNIEDIKKWIKALRSGAYKQAEGVLQADKDKFCCLGVACKIFIPEDKIKVNKNRGNSAYFEFHENELGCISGMLPRNQSHAPSWLKKINNDFKHKTQEQLSSLNDGEFLTEQHAFSSKYTFDEIADLLELVYIHKALD